MHFCFEMVSNLCPTINVVVSFLKVGQRTGAEVKSL